MRVHVCIIMYVQTQDLLLWSNLCVLNYNKQINALFNLNGPVHLIMFNKKKRHVCCVVTRNQPNHSSAAIEVDPLDVVIVGVTPVHGAAAVVERQPVGPQHIGGDEDSAVGAVHPGLLNASDAVVDLIFLPVRPVHPAAGKYARRLQKDNPFSFKFPRFLLTWLTY